MADYIRPSFSLFGAGRVGTAFAYHLFRLGWRPCFLYNRTREHLQRALRFVPFEKAAEILKAFDGSGDWWLIAVRDDAIEAVSSQLAQLPLNWNGKRVLHFSGFFSSETLQVLSKYGVLTGSLHPVMSIPTVEKGIELLSRGVFTCEGEIKAELAALARQIGGRAFLLTPQQKKIVHVAAVFLNNYYLALTQSLKDLGREAGLPPEDFVALLRPTMEQVLKTIDQSDAVWKITGPITRGDIKTIQAHQQLLEPYPILHQLYEVYLELVQQLLNQHGLSPQSTSQNRSPQE